MSRRRGSLIMKLKKTVSAVLAGAILLGTSAFAKDNIYAYNKFISTVIGPQVGYCDFAASFAGHENEYDNVNNYFSGLISAFYDDIDMDFDNELITVESSGVSVYQGSENGVTFLGSIDTDLIANYGNSYANVFTIPVGNKKYIGVETFSSVDTTYLLQMYMLDPDTDELQPKVKIEKTVNEDGREENVWANGKTYYSYTLGEGLQTVMNPDNYKDSVAAARAALTESNIPDAFVASYDRMWFGDDKNNTDNLTQNQISNRDNLKDQDDFRISHIESNASQKSYIRAKGVRFDEKPVVLFEDYSSLSELSKKPDIVTVVLDGQTLQFPTQDPVIKNDSTLVPMRTIFEALNAEVEWVDENGVQQIIAKTADKTITMTINSKEFYVNGEKQPELNEPAQLMNDKTMVPLRAVSESLDCTVEWDQETKTVIIQSKKMIKRRDKVCLTFGTILTQEEFHLKNLWR